MKIRFIVLSAWFGLELTSPVLSNAFTLISASQPRFSVKTLYVDYNASSCSSGWSEATLKTMLSAAINDYWNSIPYGGMKMKVGVDSSGSSMTLNNRLLAYCPNPWPYSASTAGVGSISSSGGSTGGFLQLNVTGGGSGDLRNMSTGAAVRVMAHEMGHTIGFGHSEKDYALMYYSIVTNGGISEDDAAAYTYLYPASLADVFTSCATTRLIRDDNDSSGLAEFCVIVGVWLLAGWGLRRRFQRTRTVIPNPTYQR